MSTVIRGAAGFVYENDDGQEVVHALSAPLRELAPRRLDRRYSWQPADYSTLPTVVTVGSPGYEVTARVRYDALPQSLLDALASSANGASVTYYKDLASREDGWSVRLVDVGDVVSLSPDADLWHAGRYEATLALRRASPFSGLLTTLALRLAGGGSLEHATFTRTGNTATRVTKDGAIETVAANVPRTVWLDLDGDGVRESAAVLLETARTNRLSEPEDFSAWGTSGTPVVTGSQEDPAGGTDAFLIEDDASDDTELVRNAATFSGDGVKVVSIHIREGPNPAASGSIVKLRDATLSEDRMRVVITWSGGEPQLNVTTGTSLGAVRLRHGWYRIAVRTTAVTASNTNNVEVWPAGTTAEEGDLYVYGAMAEDGVFLTSYTDGARGEETLLAPLPPSLAKPRAMVVYTRMRKNFDDDAGATDSGFNQRFWQIGAADGSLDPRMFHYLVDDDIRYALSDAAGTLVTASFQRSTDAGDIVESVVVLNEDSSGRVFVSVNEAAPEGADRSALATGLPDHWTDDAGFYLASAGDDGGRSAMEVLDVKIAVENLPTGTDAEILAAMRRRV